MSLREKERKVRGMGAGRGTGKGDKGYGVGRIGVWRVVLDIFCENDMIWCMFWYIQIFYTPDGGHDGRVTLFRPQTVISAWPMSVQTVSVGVQPPALLL